jgi:predicted type IV restriction endonuclease
MELSYRFYSDLVEPNKMDEKPFLEFNINEIKGQSN